MEVPVFVCLCSSCYHGLRINSTKSLGSGAGNVRQPKLVSQVGIVQKVMCASRLMSQVGRVCKFMCA